MVALDFVSRVITRLFSSTGRSASKVTITSFRSPSESAANNEDRKFLRCDASTVSNAADSNCTRCESSNCDETPKL